MNIKTEFTEPECERFRRECNFSEQEMAVFNLRVKDTTITAIEEKLREIGMPMSEATINRRISSIKKKIHKVL